MRAQALRAGLVQRLLRLYRGVPEWRGADGLRHERRGLLGLRGD
jgi:hypothetical protein